MADLVVTKGKEGQEKSNKKKLKKTSKKAKKKKEAKTDGILLFHFVAMSLQSGIEQGRKHEIDTNDP